MKIYLAIPYAGTEEESFILANKIAAKLMLEGHIVYSPISHSHPIAKQEGLPTGWEFWEKIDASFIQWCDEIRVITKHNWYKSKGVNAELILARTMGKTVRYI